MKCSLEVGLLIRFLFPGSVSVLSLRQMSIVGFEEADDL